MKIIHVTDATINFFLQILSHELQRAADVESWVHVTP